MLNDLYYYVFMKIFSGIYTWYIIPITTLMCGMWSMYHTMNIIFTGGIGKNGSTVAVSYAADDAFCMRSLHNITIHIP